MDLAAGQEKAINLDLREVLEFVLVRGLRGFISVRSLRKSGLFIFPCVFMSFSGPVG